jgi:hypothetical protein
MAIKPAPIEDTPNGVKVALKGLYVYPDGHANLTFADGTNWPLADEYEVDGVPVGPPAPPDAKRARRKAHGGRVWVTVTRNPRPERGQQPRGDRSRRGRTYTAPTRRRLAVLAKLHNVARRVRLYPVCTPRAGYEAVSNGSERSLSVGFDYADLREFSPLIGSATREA